MDSIAIFGLVAALSGAFLTAIPNERVARIGFFCFLASNLPLLWHAVQIHDTGFTILYVCFTTSSCLGIFLRTDMGKHFIQHVLQTLKERHKRWTDNP